MFYIIIYLLLKKLFILLLAVQHERGPRKPKVPPSSLPWKTEMTPCPQPILQGPEKISPPTVPTGLHFPLFGPPLPPPHVKGLNLGHPQAVTPPPPHLDIGPPPPPIFHHQGIMQPGLMQVLMGAEKVLDNFFSFFCKEVINVFSLGIWMGCKIPTTVR